MNKYRQLTNQTVVYGLGTMIPRLLNFLLLTPFYTNVFKAQENYGVISELYSYTAFLLVILTYGMETTFFRYANKYGNEKVFRLTQSIILLSSLCFMLLVVFFRQSVSDLIGYREQSYLVILFTSIVFFDVITSIPFAYLRQQNRPVYFSLVKLGTVLINVSLNIFFLVLCKNSSNPFFSRFYQENIGVGYAFISNLIASFFAFILVLPLYKKFRFTFRWGILKQFLRYSIPLVIVGFAGMYNEVADKILLKYFIPEGQNALKEMGIYSANYKMAVLMTIFIQMFKYAAEPFFFKTSSEKGSKNVYKTVMSWFVICCLFIFLGVTLFIDVFQYFIGSTYRSGLFIVPIILLANMFLGIYYNLAIWYKLNNLTRYGAIISLVGVGITSLINILFIPRYGFIASAWATFICYFSMMVISYFMGQRYFKVPYEVGTIAFVTLVALILYTLKQFIAFNSILLDNLFSVFLLGVFGISILGVKKEEVSKILKSLKHGS